MVLPPPVYPERIDPGAWADRIPLFCADVDVKYATADSAPFGKMKVKVKAEIVTLGAGDLDPAHQAGVHLDPTDWNALIADPDTVIIDTRNAYEVAVGTFENAIDPATRSFREFPAWLDDFAAKLRDEGRSPKIAMFCTGGIRCEKSTNYLLGQGVEDVFHLKGGILKYLEDVPEKDSTWQGDAAKFDTQSKFEAMDSKFEAMDGKLEEVKSLLNTLLDHTTAR